MSNGGYIKVARNMVNSDIFHKPPLYLKVWMYLLCKAYYSPCGCEGNGELKTTVDEILEACSYQSGYRKEGPTRRQIQRILAYLRADNGVMNGGNADGCAADPMIETTAGKHYISIRIVNFEKYQDIESYYNDEMFENDTISKVGGRAENNNGEIYGGTDERSHGVGDGRTSLQLKKKKNKYMAKFEVFWNAYPKKVKKQNAIKAFERLQVDDELLARMLDALEVQKQSNQWTKEGGQFIPHPATWLNGQQWEDEMEVVQKDPLRMLEEGAFTLDPF